MRLANRAIGQNQRCYASEKAQRRQRRPSLCKTAAIHPSLTLNLSEVTDGNMQNKFD